MDEELKTYLQAMEARFDERIHETETRLREHFDERIHDTETRLREHFDERIHDTETRLLRAFSDYRTGWDNRFKRIETSDATIAERLAALENRVLRLETKQ